MRTPIVTACLLVGGSSVIPALAALDPAFEQQVGGVFSNACGDRSQIMVRLYGDVLDIERAGVAVKASRLQTSKAAPSGQRVPDFKAVVRGVVKGGDSVVLLLTHNARGLFAHIEGDQKSLAPLGPGVIGLVVRHCDPNRNALPGAQAANTPQGPTDLLKVARFGSAYTHALGPLAKERWIARLDGPAPQLRSVTIAEVNYTLAASCKPHDCAQNNLVLLWNEPQSRLVGIVQQRGRRTLLGSPESALARELDRLLSQEWGRR